MFSPTLPVTFNITVMLHFFCNESHDTEPLMEKSVVLRCGAQRDRSSAKAKRDLSCRAWALSQSVNLISATRRIFTNRILASCFPYFLFSFHSPSWNRVSLAVTFRCFLSSFHKFRRVLRPPMTYLPQSCSIMSLCRD